MILLAGNKVDLDDERVIDREAAKVISTIKINSDTLHYYSNFKVVVYYYVHVF